MQSYPIPGGWEANQPVALQSMRVRFGMFGRREDAVRLGEDSSTAGNSLKEMHVSILEIDFCITIFDFILWDKCHRIRLEGSPGTSAKVM